MWLEKATDVWTFTIKDNDKTVKKDANTLLWHIVNVSIAG